MMNRREFLELIAMVAGGAATVSIGPLVGQSTSVPLWPPPASSVFSINDDLDLLFASSESNVVVCSPKIYKDLLQLTGVEEACEEFEFAGVRIVRDQKLADGIYQFNHGRERGRRINEE